MKCQSIRSMNFNKYFQYSYKYPINRVIHTIVSSYRSSISTNAPQACHFLLTTGSTLGTWFPINCNCSHKCTINDTPLSWERHTSHMCMHQDWVQLQRIGNKMKTKCCIRKAGSTDLISRSRMSKGYDMMIITCTRCH